MSKKLPNLYETEGIPLREKIIHQHYNLPFNPGFYWLIAEFDKKEKLGFGYACLNDPQMAEWGNISIQELEDVGAKRDKDWVPKPFYQALDEIERYLK